MVANFVFLVFVTPCSEEKLDGGKMAREGCEMESCVLVVLEN